MVCPARPRRRRVDPCRATRGTGIADRGAHGTEAIEQALPCRAPPRPGESRACRMASARFTVDQASPRREPRLPRPCADQPHPDATTRTRGPVGRLDRKARARAAGLAMRAPDRRRGRRLRFRPRRGLAHGRTRTGGLGRAAGRVAAPSEAIHCASDLAHARSSLGIAQPGATTQSSARPPAWLVHRRKSSVEPPRAALALLEKLCPNQSFGWRESGSTGSSSSCGRGLGVASGSGRGGRRCLEAG
jgi:hypothetical protein